MTDFIGLVRTYALSAFDRQLAFERIVGSPAWVLDQDRGRLVLDGRLELPAQVIGTFSNNNETWLWAWANETIDRSLAEKSDSLRINAQQLGVAEFEDAVLDLPRFEDPNLMALVACGVLNADAYFRGPHAGGDVFVIVDFPDTRELRGEVHVDRAVRTIEAAQRRVPDAISLEGTAMLLERLGITSTEIRDIRPGEDVLVAATIRDAMQWAQSEQAPPTADDAIRRVLDYVIDRERWEISVKSRPPATAEAEDTYRSVLSRHFVSAAILRGTVSWSVPPSVSKESTRVTGARVEGGRMIITTAQTVGGFADDRYEYDIVRVGAKPLIAERRWLGSDGIATRDVF